jgi:arginyl-tRNA synthetase
MAEPGMIRQEIERLVSEAAHEAREEGKLPAVALPEAEIERPQRPDHGDYASSVALRLARAAGAKPFELAQEIAGHIKPHEAIGDVSVAPPGFINFRLSGSWLARQVDEISAAGDSFGSLPLGEGRRIQVEYVSANPTGPLHVGNGRWAAIGSTLANVLAAAGYDVEQEYFVNDMLSQVEIFSRTLYARYQQLFGVPAEIPSDGYPGEYVIELAEEIRKEHSDRFLGPREFGPDPPPEFRTIGLNKMLDAIAADLAAMRVTYDVWFRESTLYGPDSRYEKAMALLRDKGYVTQKEGAVWFTSSTLGEDKDNVLVRSTGNPTYFASDIAYHYDKFLVRGFDEVINIWGADHQGHVSRLKAALTAMDVDPARLDIVIGQLVTLRRGGEVVRISKRAGDIVSLREVVGEVGADACRFFFLTRSADATVDFDLDLAKRQSADNPVYYVQYAHARMSGILSLGRERGVDYSDGDVALLTHPAELALIRKMLRLPELVELMARMREPHHLTHYALELATVFHDFYEKCRVVTDDVPLTKARLKLVEATGVALGRTLSLMSISAPERM